MQTPRTGTVIAMFRIAFSALSMVFLCVRTTVHSHTMKHEMHERQEMQILGHVA